MPEGLGHFQSALVHCSSTDAHEWQPRPGLDLPALVDLWRLPDADLRALVKGSPMTRAKLTGLRRNIAVAIGNSRDAAACAVLDERSPDRPSAGERMVQQHVVG